MQKLSLCTLKIKVFSFYHEVLFKKSVNTQYILGLFLRGQLGCWFWVLGWFRCWLREFHSLGKKNLFTPLSFSVVEVQRNNQVQLVTYRYSRTRICSFLQSNFKCINFSHCPWQWLQHMYSRTNQTPNSCVEGLEVKGLTHNSPFLALLTQWAKHGGQNLSEENKNILSYQT